MAHYVKFKFGKKFVVMRNRMNGLTKPSTEDSIRALNSILESDVRRTLKAKKKEIKREEALNLRYLGISDNKLLRKLVRIGVDELLDSLDVTEEAIESNERIYNYYY